VRERQREREKNRERDNEREEVMPKREGQRREGE
jgi:hypothetical protein